MRGLAESLEVGDLVRFSGGFVPLPDLVDALARADVGVLAMRRDPFRDVTLPGKIFDFIAMGLPVVASRTRSMQETFGDCVELFTADDPDDLARALLALHRDPARRAALVAAARATSEPLRWEHQRRRYLTTVADLAAGSPVGRPPDGPSPAGRTRSDPGSTRFSYPGRRPTSEPSRSGGGAARGPVT